MGEAQTGGPHFSIVDLDLLPSGFLGALEEKMQLLMLCS